MGFLAGAIGEKATGLAGSLGGAGLGGAAGGGLLSRVAQDNGGPTATTGTQRCPTCGRPMPAGGLLKAGTGAVGGAMRQLF